MNIGSKKKKGAEPWTHRLFANIFMPGFFACEQAQIYACLIF